MASVYSVTTQSEEALAAATAETVVQLRGSTAVKAKIVEWGVSFDGTSATAEPVRVRLLRQTTDGTSGTAGTEVAWDPDNPTANCTSHLDFSAEPAAGDVLADYEVHPQTGIVVQYPLGREPTLDNAATSRVGIDCNAPATVNAVAYLVWEE
jgi:hypothetical protein